MSKFVRLTVEEEPVLVNTSLIVKIEKIIDSNDAVIYMFDGSVIYPQEDFYTISGLVTE